MDFNSGIIGLRYNIWVFKVSKGLSIDWVYDYSGDPNFEKLPATLVGYYHSGNTKFKNAVLGWMAGEVYPPTAIQAAVFNNVSMLPGHLDLSKFHYISAACTERWCELIADWDSVPTVKSSAPIANGAYCIKCNDWNEYAIPTIGLDKYKCYSCRN
jgi:hypothetical protein